MTTAGPLRAPWEPLPAAADQAEGLAIRYNERLRAQFEEGFPTPLVARNDRPRLLPRLLPGGAGLIASASF